MVFLGGTVGRDKCRMAVKCVNRFDFSINKMKNPSKKSRLLLQQKGFKKVQTRNCLKALVLKFFSA